MGDAKGAMNEVFDMNVISDDDLSLEDRNQYVKHR